MIYAPALVKSPPVQPMPTQGNMDVDMENARRSSVNEIVSEFVDAVRLENRQDEMEKERRRASIASNGQSGLDEAKARCRKSVQEAEKFQASIAVPKPGEEIIKYAIPDIGSGVSDDDFFHLTCHIDPTLIHRIEKGEYVELEKLLPKEKLGGVSGNENRLEWVHRDGGTFLVPAQKDSKIGSFRKWEQAFRAYATIYCGANPQCSKEIWQYIMVINTAASSYLWENVYNYDITFRHLMAFNPQRSWVVTYNQMWNLSMRDPIPKFSGQKQFGSGQQFQFGGNGAKTSNTSGLNQAGKKKSDYCWNFNKGVPCRFGNRCRFIERCSYCDSPAHAVINCPKVQKKNDKGDKRNSHDQNKVDHSNKA